MGYWMIAVYDLGWLSELLKIAYGPLSRSQYFTLLRMIL